MTLEKIADAVAPYLWVADYVPGIGDTGHYLEDPRTVAEAVLKALEADTQEDAEWEYGTRWVTKAYGDEEPTERVSRWHDDVEMAEWNAEQFRGMPLHYASAEVVRRRTAGPWEEL